MRMADVEEALRALDVELGGAKSPPIPRGTRNDWKKAAQWCRDHPGVPFVMDPVWLVTVWRLKVANPDLVVRGANQRRGPSGGKVSSLYMAYRPEFLDEEDEWAREFGK